MARFIRRAIEVEAQQFNPGDVVTPWPAGIKLATDGSGYVLFTGEKDVSVQSSDWVCRSSNGPALVVSAGEFARDFEPARSTLSEHLVTSSGAIDRLDLPADLTEAEARHCLEGNFADFAAAPIGFYVQGRKVDEAGFKAAVAKVAVAIPFKDGGGAGSAVGWISRGPVPVGFAV